MRPASLVPELRQPTRAVRPFLAKRHLLNFGRRLRNAAHDARKGAKRAPQTLIPARVRQQQHAPEFVVLLRGKAIKKERVEEGKEFPRERGHLLRR